MSLFKQYLEAVVNSKQEETKKTYFSAKPGDLLKVVRPKTAKQKSTTSKMKIDKITDNDVHYTWIDSNGNETKGKVSKSRFYHDVESGEITKIESV